MLMQNGEQPKGKINLLEPQSVPWVLQLAFWAQDSYFGRSSYHFEQWVRTFAASAAILSKGFELWARQLPF